MRSKIFLYLKRRVLPALAVTKNYARIVGVILFVMGLFGFAFRSDNSLPDLYLGGALLLGFWGIVSGLWDSNGHN
jgi:xanthine/uracil permease